MGSGVDAQIDRHRSARVGAARDPHPDPARPAHLDEVLARAAIVAADLGHRDPAVGGRSAAARGRVGLDDEIDRHRHTIERRSGDEIGGVGGVPRDEHGLSLPLRLRREIEGEPVGGVTVPCRPMIHVARRLGLGSRTGAGVGGRSCAHQIHCNGIERAASSLPSPAARGAPFGGSLPAPAHLGSSAADPFPALTLHLAAGVSATAERGPHEQRSEHPPLPGPSCVPHRAPLSQGARRPDRATIPQPRRARCDARDAPPVRRA